MCIAGLYSRAEYAAGLTHMLPCHLASKSASKFSAQLARDNGEDAVLVIITV
jgi:hypothetical protein